MNRALKPLPAGLSIITAIALAVIALRCASLGLTGLIDTTEGRYGAVAQEMYLSGNWVTPMVPLEEGFVPYWGKPPLHFWTTALTYSVFPMNEWSSRFPGFLAALVTCLFTAAFARAFFKPGTASLAVTILITSALFFFLAGGVALDMTLTAGISGGIVSYLLATRENAPRRSLWGALFFLSLAAASLTKGPIGIVLVGVPLAFWLLISREWRTVVRLPWLWGVPLYLLVTVPWFLIAERATPGFLYYFFVNENFQRYLIADYNDRYGSGHRRAYGMSWVMLALGFLPWTGLFGALVGAYRRCGAAIPQEIRSPLFAALAWGLAPALFFTFARQLTGTYLLPAMPGLALSAAAAVTYADELGIAARCRAFLRWSNRLVWLLTTALIGLGVWTGAGVGATLMAAALFLGSMWLGRTILAQRSDLPTHAAVTGLFAGIALICTVVSGSHVVTEQRSTKFVLDKVKAVSPANSEVGIFFGFPYSAFFYDNTDPAHEIKIVRLDPEKLQATGPRFFIVRNKDMKRLPPAAQTATKIKEVVGHWTWLELVQPAA